MNTQSTALFVTISKKEIEILTKEVKETLAVENSHSKIFSTADMWNILRQRKSSTPARRFA